MKDEKKTKKQLIEELHKLRRRLARCETSKSKGKRPQGSPLEGERSFRALAANANDGILIANEKGRYVYANKRASRMTGYSLAELLQIGVQDLTHADEVRKVTGRFKKRITGAPVPRQYETVIVRKNGESLPIELTAAKTVWHGQPAGLAIIRDIAERKRTEDLVRKSEEKYRALVEPSLQGIVILQGIPPRVVFANPSAAKILGLTVNEFLSLSTKQMFARVKLPPKEQKDLLQRYLERLEGVPAPTSQEFCLNRADGTTRCVEVFAKDIEFDGKPSVQVVLIDITERKQAEEALRESEERYKALFDRSLYCVYIHDFEGRFLDANKAALKLLGYQKKDIPSLKFTSLLDEDQLPRVKKILNEIKRSAFQKRPSLYKLRRKDGNDVWVETEASVIYRQGKPYAIQGIARDITEKKWTEEILREREERFRLAFEDGPIGMAFVGRDFKLLKVNKVFCKMLEYTEAEISKLTFVDITHPEDIDKDVQLAKQVFKGKRASYKIEKRYIKKNGEILWANLTATVIRNQEGKVLYGLAMIEDVTERKRAKDALQESELRYRTTINSIGDVIHVVDRDLRLILINPAFKKWAQMFKLRTDIIGRPLLEAFPFLSNKIRNEYRRVFRTAKPLITEERTEIEGQEYITETRKIPILDGEKVVRVITVIRDFTEQRRAEEGLRESEEQYRALVEESLQGLVITKGIPPRILFVNPRAAEILGYTVDEIMKFSPGKLLKLVHIEDQHIFRQRMRAREDGESLGNNFEFRVVRKDRFVRWVEIFSTNILYRGEPAVQTAILDSTERKEAERELRDREEYYSHLIENLTDIIVVVEKDGTIRYISPSVKEVNGYNPSDLIDTTLFEHLHTEDIASVETFFNEAIKTPGITSPVEHRIRREDGSWAYLESVGNNLLDNPVVEGMIVTSRDITQRKQAERELRIKENAIASSINGIGIADLQGKLVYVNDSAVRMWGYDHKDEIIGRHLPDFWEGEGVLETVRALREKGARIGEDVGRRKDGSLFDIQFATSMIKDKDGNPIYMFGSFLDITERKRDEEELRKHREHLEELVEERTAELHKINEQLKGEIEERKKAEAALRQSEATKRALLNATTDSALLLDLEGKILAINEVAAKRLGKRVEDLVNISVKKLFPPLLFKARKVHGEDAVRSGKPSRYEDIREGRIFDNSVYPVLDSKGKVIQLAVFARDITKRKKMELELREREERYRSLVETSPDGITLTDLNANILMCNQQTAEIHGYESVEEMIGKKGIDLIAPEDHERARENTRKIIEKQRVRDLEYSLLKKDGSRFPGELSVSVITDAEGKPKAFMGLTRDITERKRMELTQRALQQIANAVYTTEDLDELFKAIHKELGTILNTKNFFIALLNRDSNTISFPYHKDERDPYVETLPIGKTLTGYVIRKDQPLLATRTQIKRMAKTGLIELLGAIPEIWLGVPMRVRNKKIGALVVQNYEDATAIDQSDLDILKFVSGQVGLSIERKRAEEQLKETLEELARSNAELEQFAHIASHDLQEPLQAVAMSIEIVAKRHKDKFDATANKFIKYAVDESNRMQMLVQDLLTYSRVGRGGIEFKPIDCLLVLDQTLDNLLVPIEQSDAKITHGPLPTVMGDPLQLTQVLQNLIDNAIKFRREEPPRIHVTATRKGDEWVFAVSDNGMGFDPKHAEKIFAAFERLLDKTRYLGTGIGLAICRKIVERHGGRIWAESKAGEGAIFYFTIPVMKGTSR